MKVRIIAIAVGLFIVAGAQANQITFRGVVTSAVGTGIFSPPPIAVGDRFSGAVIFDSSNIVSGAFVVFPSSGLSTGGEPDGGAILDLVPISNGYSFEGTFIGGLGGTDSFFSFEFHDTVNSFMASGSSFPGTGEDIVDFHNYTGRITQFSVPESGKTALLLVVSLTPIVAAQMRRLLVG